MRTVAMKVCLEVPVTAHDLYLIFLTTAAGEPRYDRARSASPRGDDRVVRNRSMSPNGRAADTR